MCQRGLKWQKNTLSYEYYLLTLFLESTCTAGKISGGNMAKKAQARLQGEYYVFARKFLNAVGIRIYPY